MTDKHDTQITKKNTQRSTALERSCCLLGLRQDRMTDKHGTQITKRIHKEAQPWNGRVAYLV